MRGLLSGQSRPYRDISLCACRMPQIPTRTARRWIGTKYLQKVAQAEMDWQDKAFEIRAGKRKSMLSILEERGLVHQLTGDRKEIEDIMTKTRIGAYVGVDPTAASLHVGHLLPLMCLYWLYFHGYHAVSLLGGATMKIGDPTGRTKDREVAEKHVQASNLANMHYQLKKLWLNVEKHGVKYGYKWEWAWRRELENNNQWMNKLRIMELLQVLGNGMRLGPMLGRDTVKNKMASEDGMSFAEFTYPLLQAWDWWHMYKTKGVHLQIGGSDQFGNIIAGLNAVKYISANHADPNMRDDKDCTGTPPFGFTTPLLTTASGAKFGKSAGNAVWLNRDLTSTFDLYGYFVRQPDADVGRLLRLFTFMPIEEIDSLVATHMENPSKRAAQHRLAREVVEMIHGEEEAKHAEMSHRIMYNNPAAELPPKSTLPEHEYRDRPAASKILDTNYPHPLITLNNAPDINIKLPESLVYHKSIGKILFAAGLVRSAQEGHRLATQQGAWVGGVPNQKAAMNTSALSFTPIKLWYPEETRKFLINDKLLILRRGKHNVRIIEIISDDEYKQLGLTYPGMVVGEQVTPEQTKEAVVVPGNAAAEEVVSKRQAKKETYETFKKDDTEMRAAQWEVRELRKKALIERGEDPDQGRDLGLEDTSGAQSEAEDYEEPTRHQQAPQWVDDRRA